MVPPGSRYTRKYLGLQVFCHGPLSYVVFQASLTQCAGAMATAGFVFKIGTVSGVAKAHKIMGTVVGTWLGASAACDILIAVSMICVVS